MVVAPTWETVTLPVLEHIASLEDAESPQGPLTSEALAETVGQPVQQVDSELVRLHAAGYLRGRLHLTGLGSRLHQLNGAGLTEKGARAVGKWPPNDPYDLLLLLVEQRIATASSQEERSRWQRFRDGLVDVGKSGAGGLLVELTKAATGLNA